MNLSVSLVMRMVVMPLKYQLRPMAAANSADSAVARPAPITPMSSSYISSGSRTMLISAALIWTIVDLLAAPSPLSVPPTMELSSSAGARMA